MTTHVNVDNFARAESNRMLAKVLQDAGDLSTWFHFREPSPLDHQTIIRLNRDTLYSGAVVDVSEGVTITIPEADGRYISIMAVTQDHYIPLVLHDAGEHRLTAEQLGTDFVLFGARILVDPSDPADVAAVNALQDELQITAGASRPFTLPEYDPTSLDRTRDALLQLARDLGGFAHAFGAAGEVDPVRHLIGAAAGWGGLPESEAYYQNVDLGWPVQEYSLTVKDVPVDAFWSISLYDAQGYFVPNSRNVTSVNSVTALTDADGSVTVRFGPREDGDQNYLTIMPGWNYLVRYYRPRPEVVDGTWVLPDPVVLEG